MDKVFLLTKLLQCSAQLKSFETESWDILFSQPCDNNVAFLKIHAVRFFVSGFQFFGHCS